ncbi:serine/threonine/tyrosine-interacting protein-like isoform X4 [Scylla paramamosain]|uniref:serine/threonine/tyrosine-interacting protein-like isoform X4 n=1 Tax=Scylla paramamosain TaxID=85552 RepID=UPI0030835ED3
MVLEWVSASEFCQHWNVPQHKANNAVLALHARPFLSGRKVVSDGIEEAALHVWRSGRQRIAVNMEVDWQYPMRREMQEILPGLYLGPYSAATKSRFNTLLDHGITHIICIRQSIESHMVRANFPDKIKEALEFVQNRRYCINPNDGFKQQLMEYEAIYKAQQTLLNGQCSQEKGKLKRKHDQTSDDFDQDSSEPMEAVS